MQQKQKDDRNDPVLGLQTAPLTSPTTTTISTTTATITAADVALTPSQPAAGKKRRGRPPRAQGKSLAAVTENAGAAADEDEEDVCFICFDGGNLVLCDRRGCPKAYHPACIKRDEAYFQSKAKWNCGWHICSTCEKASHYLCYTCTFSLCQGCTKDADYVCMRGNFGLCGTCMKTIMLIENIAPGNNEMVQVDFDDKTSWEYLFKIYWVSLKTKLLLTAEDLTKAKNPWKGDQLPKARNTWKVAGAATDKHQSYLVNGEKNMWSDNCYAHSGTNHLKRTKVIDATRSDNMGVISGVQTQPFGAMREVDSDKIWHYQDPTGTIQGPFSMMQLRQWSAGGYFPLDLRVWRTTEKLESSILLTDALVGKFRNELSQPPPVNFLHQGVAPTSNETSKKWQCELNLNIDANLLDNPKAGASVCSDSNSEPAQSNGGDGLAKSLPFEHGSLSKPLVDEPHRDTFSVPETKLLLGHGPESEKCTAVSININESACKADGLGENEKKLSDTEYHSSQSASSSSSGFVSTIKPIEISKQNEERVFENCQNAILKQQSKEDFDKVQATENSNKQSFCLNVPAREESSDASGRGQATANNNSQPFCLNVPLVDSQHSWSTASSLAVREWTGYAPTSLKPSIEEWDFNIVPASALKPSVLASDTNHTAATSSGINLSPWQPIIADAPDFCSFADESVSDLLAEVEAMESMGGFPSPTSKMSSGVGELARGPDHDFFSPVEGFSTPAAAPLLDLGKSNEALSSTSTNDVVLPSQFMAANMLLQLSMPSRPTTSTDESGQESQMPRTGEPLQPNFTDEPIVTSKALQPSNILLQSEPLEPSKKNPNGHLSAGANVAEDLRPNIITNLTPQPPTSRLNQREGAPASKQETPMVKELEAAHDTCLPPPPASQDSPNGNHQPGHDAIAHQEQPSSTSLAAAAGNQATWGSQPPRQGGDRQASHLIPQDREHHYHSHLRDSSSNGNRDSGGYGRDRPDRSLWNRQQYYGGGGGGGGGSHRQAILPAKGMRVCKFYEQGYCKKGASCSFWHP